MLPSRLLTAICLAFVRSHSRTYHSLCVNVLRELLTYISRDVVLAGLSGSELRVYNITARAVAKKRVGVNVDLLGAVLVLSGEDLLVIGRTAAVVSVSIATGAVVRTACPMTKARYWPGAIAYSGFIWVFGGVSEDSDPHSYPRDGVSVSAERCDASHKAWRPLPALSFPAVFFTPCEWQSRIYLPQSSAEGFDILDTGTLQYATARVSLGTRVVGSVSFILEGELVLIDFFKRAGSWLIGSDEKNVRRHSVADSGVAFCCAITAPVKEDGSVYWLGESCEVVRCDWRGKGLLTSQY